MLYLISAVSAEIGQKLVEYIPNAMFQMFSVASRYLPDAVLQHTTSIYFKALTWKNYGFRGVHSQPAVETFNEMHVRILPALNDNYMYLIIDDATKEAAIVDPVAPDTVLKAVADEQVNLTKVLTTHHHWDHAGGNEEIFKKVPNLKVYGGDDRIKALNNKVKMDDEITLGNLKIRCLFTPCHTTGHVCYLVQQSDNQPGAVFTGDTLFSAGCGRFFEGTAEQMCRALLDILGRLPDETKVFCGHEYTQANLRFAQHVEPNNDDIMKHIEWVKEKRNQKQPTVPSSIQLEKKINPFMRVTENAVKAHTKQEDRISVMQCLRQEKDNFK